MLTKIRSLLLKEKEKIYFFIVLIVSTSTIY